MDRDGRDNDLTELSRRSLLMLTALGVVAGGSTRAPAAAHQVSKAEARYQDRPKNGLSCAACALFRPPSACVAVAGTISPHGWCRFFDLPD